VAHLKEGARNTQIAFRNLRDTNRVCQSDSRWGNSPVSYPGRPGFRCGYRDAGSMWTSSVTPSNARIVPLGRHGGLLVSQLGCDCLKEHLAVSTRTDVSKNMQLSLRLCRSLEEYVGLSVVMFPFTLAGQQGHLLACSDERVGSQLPTAFRNIASAFSRFPLMP
jgi:hypothetical protein